jgi:hypothetical protein
MPAAGLARRATLVVAAVMLFAVTSAGAASTKNDSRRATRTPGQARTVKPAAPPPIVRYRVRAASTIDLGWTGIAHHQPWPGEQRIEFALTCGEGGSCTVSGGDAGAVFGAPVPLSTGGVPACVVNRLRAPLTGTADPATGCGELRLALTSTVHTAADVAQPCPRCNGDHVPNDGRKQGRCAGGLSSGNACDANSASALFGATSNDCLPSQVSVIGTLAIEFAPLTTGAVRIAAERECRLRRPGLVDHCYCPEQRQPNECSSGSCEANELCEGPVDGVCSRAPYRSCSLGTGTRECEGLVAGTGTCEARIRPCFGDAIAATGSCHRTRPTYVALFCAPATQAPAINASAGLPGPARLRLALEAIPAAATRR